MTTPTPVSLKDMTFQKICELEPEVLEIYAEAKRAKKENTLLWRTNLQPRLEGLVGSHAKQIALRGYDVFALTIDTVRSALAQKKK